MAATLACKQVIDLFRKYDVNGDGTIDRTELGYLLRNLRGPGPQDVDALLSNTDINGDGKVHLEEFFTWVFAAKTQDVSIQEDLAELDHAKRALASAPCYYYKGRKYESTEDVLTAMCGNGGTVGKCSAEHTAAQLINGAVEKHCRAIFSLYAGKDGRLQMDEIAGLVRSVAAECGIDTRALHEAVNLSRVFYRFDFSGDQLLDAAEGTMLVHSMLRHFWDHLKPPEECLADVHLAHKDFSSEYDLHRMLGKCGQGCVYSATHKNTGEKRVAKIFDKSNKAAPVDDIKDEFGLLMGLHHPNIQRVFDIFEDCVNVYMVCEPYEGGTLDTLIDNAMQHEVKLSRKWLANVLLQVLQGIDYLHSNYIMHCDLKEVNIMVPRADDWSDPRIVVIDLGLAGSFIDGGNMLGTIGYAPPEVYTHALWTPKGDIHALGVVFYHVLSGGKQCYPGHTGAQVKEATLRLSPDFRCVKSVPPVTDLLKAMLNKDLRKRSGIRQCFQHPFFSDVHPDEVIPPEMLSGLKRLSTRKALAQAILTDVAETMNLAQLREINEQFVAADSNNDGTASPDEVRARFSSTMGDEKIEQIIVAMGGELGAMEYTTFMGQALACTIAHNLNMLWMAFTSLDTDNTGKLGMNELTALLKGQHVAAVSVGRTAQDLVSVMDFDNDGMVSFEEFKRVLCKD